MKSWWENVSSDLFSEIKVQRSAEPIKNHQELLISARFLHIFKDFQKGGIMDICNKCILKESFQCGFLHPFFIIYVDIKFFLPNNLHNLSSLAPWLIMLGT